MMDAIASDTFQHLLVVELWYDDEGKLKSHEQHHECQDRLELTALNSMKCKFTTKP